MQPRKRNRPKGRPPRTSNAESRASEALTVAWTVTVTTVLMCNLAILAAHFYLSSNPEAKRMEMLQELMLLTGIMVGTLSLILLPIVMRVRRVPPPTGLVAFSVCLAAAPILVFVMRLLN